MNNGGVKVGPKRKILEGSMRAMEHFISRMTRAKIENTNK
jgi:DNA-binding cell septation regulator SpoVG